MGLKYFTRYRTIDGSICEIRFSKEDFDGTPTEWISTKGAVDFEYGGFDGMFSNPIQPSRASMTFFLKEFYDLSDFVFNRKTYFCEIENLDTNIIKWSGWVEPWGAERDYKKAPHEVNLMASCGLAHLSKKKYVNNTNVFKKTGLTIIQECLAIIGSTLPIRVSTHMVETTWGGDDRLGLNSFEINTSRYFDNNGEAMYCDVIINDILNHLNAEIVQWENRWVIRAVVDHATGFYNSFIDIGTPDGPLYFPYTYPINVPGGAVTLDGGTTSILPPKNKYRAEVDFGTQVPFFENGNMLLWNEDGLIGWDFTHMNKSTTDGWERFEMGGEVSRGVLKINGISPPPYSKFKPKKRKNQWLKNLLVMPLLVDAIGIVKKRNTIIDIEPAQYVESPGGTITKGDKSVTLSFDYETEAFSPAILISIRIPVVQPNGKIVNIWVDPNSSVALAGADKSAAGGSEEFTLIRIDPVDMGALTDKGTLDVSGNPNYPSANWIPGSKQTNWTWTVTGVPSGEYRRVGGINGVLVENGDLVISRIPNFGGSQAEVGGSWEVIGIRHNIKKATFSITVAINTLVIPVAGQPFPADKIYIRFYKMSNDAGFSGDWYKVYNLGGALEGFVAKEESAQYATTLERGDVTDEEAETITLISGDYNPWYAGSWTKPGSKENTRTWRRRPDLNEAMSIWRAMMLDRLCLTSRSLNALDGEIKLANGSENLTFLHTLVMHDMGDMRMRMTRFSFNDYSRRVTFRAVEVKYEEIPREELKQNSYIPGSRQLNTVPGEGDGIYPSKQDSTNGRLNAEKFPLTDEEILELTSNGRLAALFENIPPLIFTAGELSTDSVDLSKYLSEVVLFNNANQEVEDQFDFNTLKWETLKKPSWVTAQSIVFLNASVTGKPLYVGKDSITFKVGERPEELTAEEEAEALAEQIELEEWAEENGVPIPPTPEFYIEVTIPIEVYPKTILVHELLDTSGATPIVIGSLPGVYPLPARWDIRTRIKGMHDWWQQTLFAGGAAGNDPMRNVSQNVLLNEDGTYRMFEEENGIVTEAGQYRKYTTTSVTEVIVSRNNIVFTLYTGEFLENGSFFLRKNGVDIAPISLDGTSIFENPEGCDIVFVSDGVEYDKITIKLTTKDEQPVDDNYLSLPDPQTEESGELGVFGEDSVLPNNIFTVQASMFLDDVEVLERFTDFTFVKKKPEAKGGGLALVEKVPNSLNFKFLAPLPKSGSQHTLVPFNVKVTGESPLFNRETWTYQISRGGARVTVDLSKYTGRPQTISYNNPVEESDLHIFGTLSSLDIDAIHEEDTTHRVVVTRDLDGTVVDILQADFSFGEYTDLDELPDEDETSNIVDYVARDGVGEETINYVKYFDVLYDGLTIGLNEDNELEVIEDSILFKHMQPIGGMSLIGNLTDGTINPYAVLVKDVFEEAEIGDLVTPIAIHNHMVQYVTEQLENSITGTPGYFPIYDTEHTFEDSIVRQAAGKVGFGITPTEVIHAAGNILATGQLKSTIPTGTSPLTVASITLVTNLNADLLDGQHGPYYLDWDNFTNHRSVLAGSGLVTGGLLDVDVTLNMGLPSTLSNVSTNAVTTDSHTHAIQASSLIAGTNVSFSASGSNVILGPNNITIDVAQVPWGIVINRPTTLTGYGITDSLTTSEVTGLLTGKEDTFAKGDLVSGVGISLSGSLIDRLVGSADAIISLATTGVVANTYRSVTVDSYGRVTNGSNPTTIAGYGLTDVYSISQVDNLLLGYVPTTRIITINGVSLDLSQNRTFTIPSGVSGTAGYIPVFTSSTAIGNSVIRDTGTEINIANTRSFGVEGPAAMRDYLHVHGYVGIGKSGQHGALVIHSASSATAHGSAAIDIQSTTKGLLLPRMTYADRIAIVSPSEGLVVYQTDDGSPGPGGIVGGKGLYLCIGSGFWIHHLNDYLGP